MLERARALAFAGGALVFPGGRVDAGDRALAAGPDLAHLPDAAARVAAVRETLEEAGLAVGLDPPPDAGAAARLRAGLAAGGAFGALLRDAGAALAPDRLVPFARWRPDGGPSRTYDTRFYLARLSDGAGSASPDGTETARLFWARAADVLADADAGRATLIYPTRRTLERLARFGSFAEAAADAAAHPVRRITPWVERRDGVDHLCIPPGLGYPVTSEPLGTVSRG